MGDPRRLRKKYSGPRHPWQRARMDDEKKLRSEYGFKTKTELWKASSALKSFANQAKKLIALRTEQGHKEAKQLLDRLARLGLLSVSAKLDDVLGLSVHDVLDRRLQTLVVKKGLARTQKQARQFIVHEHILVGDKTVNTPSYLVPVSEESQIFFTVRSSLSKDDHPERVIAKTVAKSVAKGEAQ
ncbi:30S ribosomal protein S4 [Candidatus Woesearchaeota archaeon CG10_big_fil_rev_8_21_14_0_10_37_12]|nr:MAG: 30S ribosomal protein S4 [Candidatus Woesearchaeota archaeon CG10_big_fil_rev_8_21_14_0_10_37_12]